MPQDKSAPTCLETFQPLRLCQSLGAAPAAGQTLLSKKAATQANQQEKAVECFQCK
jgi:hypothetical protein